MRRFLIAVIVVLIGFLTVGWADTVVTPPAAPVATVTMQPVPTAYPGNKLQWDQPVADAAEAAIIKNTIAWDGQPKADVPATTTCTAYVASNPNIVCTMPLPATTPTGNHTVVLTAYKMVNDVRYESVGSDPFAFAYVVPSNPSNPSGCRIVK